MGRIGRLGPLKGDQILSSEMLADKPEQEVGKPDRLGDDEILKEEDD